MHQRIVLEQMLFNRANKVNIELIMKHGNAIYDLLLLVVLFWHRYMLKKQGIWTMQRTNSEVLLLEKMASNNFILIEIKMYIFFVASNERRSYNKEKPEDILERLR